MEDITESSFSLFFDFFFHRFSLFLLKTLENWSFGIFIRRCSTIRQKIIFFFDSKSLWSKTFARVIYKWRHIFYTLIPEKCPVIVTNSSPIFQKHNICTSLRLFEISTPLTYLSKWSILKCANHKRLKKCSDHFSLMQLSRWEWRRETWIYCFFLSLLQSSAKISSFINFRSGRIDRCVAEQIFFVFLHFF